MKNKITGLKLEEIIKFDSKKFKSCIVRYNGEVGGNAFEKEITFEQTLMLHNSIYTAFHDKKESEILENPDLSELVYPDSHEPYANIIAKVSKYDLVRK